MSKHLSRQQWGFFSLQQFRSEILQKQDTVQLRTVSSGSLICAFVHQVVFKDPVEEKCSLHSAVSCLQSLRRTVEES